MAIYSFFLKIHLNRFSDLAFVVSDHVVIIEPFSVGDDNTVEVHIKGESEITRRLDRSLQKIKDILASAPVLEWSE